MESKALKPDFQKSLKDGYRYPLLHHFRVERYVTRPLSWLIVRAVFRTSITPNHLTCVSFLLGLAGGFLFCGGSHLYFVLGGILAYSSSIFDSADGMMARAKNMCTHYGTYLDLFLDRIADFFIFAGINVGYFRYSHNLTYFIIGFVAIGLYFLQVSLYYIIIAFKRTPKTGQASEVRGLMLFVIMVVAVINHLEVLILILIVETVLNVAFKLVYFIRMDRNDDHASNT